MELGPRNISARLLTKANIYEEPRKAGDVVDVDATTFRNLEKKGILERADKNPPKPAKKQPAAGE